MKPPKRPPKSSNTCPACGSRATKIFHLSADGPPLECQICGHRYDFPAKAAVPAQTASAAPKPPT